MQSCHWSGRIFYVKERILGLCIARRGRDKSGFGSLCNFTYKDVSRTQKRPDSGKCSSLQTKSHPENSLQTFLSHTITIFEPSLNMRFSWLVLAPLASALILPATPLPTPPTLPGTLDRRQDTTVSSAASAVPTGNFITTKHIIIPGVTNSHVNIPAKTIDLALPTCIQTIEPDANGYVPPGECGAIWNYYPSFAAAMVFAVLFGALTAIHIWQAARHKKVRMSRRVPPICAMHGKK